MMHWFRFNNYLKYRKQVNVAPLQPTATLKYYNNPMIYYKFDKGLLLFDTLTTFCFKTFVFSLNNILSVGRLLIFL